MKSKTSCFNRTIFKKNFTHYWPLWALYLGYLLLSLPVSIWQTATSKWYYANVSENERMYSIVNNAVDAELFTVPVFLFAAVIALAVFSYLYSAKNANMIHALPVNRLELYLTNYLSGLSFLIIPELITFLVSVLVCLANQITCIQYLFVGFLCQAGTSFFAYSLAVFVAMFTGQILALPVYYFIVNYLYVGCLFIISRVIGLVSYGISDAWNPGKSCILSPIYYLRNNLRAHVVYEDGSEVIEGIQIQGTYLVGIYAAVAVVLLVAAYQLYKRRQIETAGDWISIGIVKPVFRWGVALCGGMLVATLFAGVLKETRNADEYLSMIFSIVITGFIGFFVAEMLLEKNFRVFRKKRLLEWAGFTIVAVAFITLFKVDAFGVERRLPEADEIEVAFVNMDYPLQMETDEIPVLLELHRNVIESKEEYLDIAKQERGYYYTTFRYYLKNGTVFERRYALPVTESYITDTTAPSGQILAWEKEAYHLKKDILGPNYTENEYVSGNIDLYDEEQKSQNHIFTSEELKQVVTAIEKDIEEGNFDNYYLNSAAEKDTVNYCNMIYLDCYNRKSYDNWDYYYNYKYYKKAKESNVQESAVNTSRYINFGPECINTVAALERLGIVDDTWKLFTQEEYEQLTVK